MPDLAALAEPIDWPDHDASRALAARTGTAGAPAGTFGQLEEHAQWLAGVQAANPPRDIQRARVLVIVADHGVTEAGVSAYSPGSTDTLAADISEGRAALAKLAALGDIGVRVAEAGLDGAGVRRASGRIDQQDALTAQQVVDAVAFGAALADDEIDRGADLLIVGNVGAGSTTVASTLVTTITAIEPVKTIGRGGSRIDDAQWMNKAVAVRDARLRAWPHRSDPMRLLAVAGGADVAAIAGVVLQAAARRTPLLLDGAVAAAGALVANQTQPRASRWWRAAQGTAEPAQQIALRSLGLTPLLELGISAGDGTGGLLALQLLRSAVAATSA